MRKYFCLLMLLALGLMSKIYAQKVSITVTNQIPLQRQEVVEANLQDICLLLGVGKDEPLVVRNALGQQIAYQKSYDGKLLFCTALQPGGKAVYTVTKGTPVEHKPAVFGRVYPERLDDLTWENDRGIYRMYGPALQRTGERSFGTDVWVKNTPDLLAAERYRLHMWGWAKGDSLKKAGRTAEGNELLMSTSFHLDHGNGMDVYSVGPSLGCGAPARMSDGQLVFPYCFQECQIRENGPLRFTVELTYGATKDGVTEHRLISLDKGSHFNRMTVWYDGIIQPTALATGVVTHGTDELILDTHYVLYADPTDNPRVHQSQIYVGTLFPNGIDETLKLNGNPSHAIGVKHQYKGERYTYYFGSAWSNYDVCTMAHWRLIADEKLRCVKNPLAVEITKAK